MQAKCRFWPIFLIFWCLTAIYDLQAQQTAPLPPTHVRGQQVANRFASQKDLINVITWKSPAGGITPVAYKIYRNSNLTELAATIPANEKLKFKDHNRQKNHFYTYFLVSVDAAGNQSTPIAIFFNGSKVRIEQNLLASIVVTPVDPKVATGFTVQFTAMGIFSDNTTIDLTNEVTWSSSIHKVASISNARRSQGLAKGLSPGTTQITAALNGVAGSTILTVTSAALVAIEVTPVDPVLAQDFTLQFTAMGIFSDGTTEDITNEVKWTSSNRKVATISNARGSQGLATGLSPGTTQIVATIKGVSGSSGESSQFLGATEALRSKHSHSNNSSGRPTISGSTTLKVTAAALQSIEIDPIDPIVASGFTVQFTAMGIFSDGTTENLTNEVTWASSNPAVAEISNARGRKGLALGLSPGITTITATNPATGISGSTTLTVTGATLVEIEVVPIDPVIALGFDVQFMATGIFSDNTTEDLTKEVTWTSSDLTIAEISNAAGSQGLATAIGIGFAQITATHGGISGSTTLTVTGATLLSITVTPANSIVAAGFTVPFTATGNFSDGTIEDLTKKVTWESSNLSVAEISNATGSQGVAKGLTQGTVIIIAINPGTGVSGSTMLTVTSAVLVSIAVTPIDPEVAKGLPVQFTAIGTFSDGSTENLTNQVTWSSSNTTIAKISNDPGEEGLAKTENIGSVLITAKNAATGISGSTTLTVTSAVLVSIAVTPANPTIVARTTQQFTATGTFSDGTFKVLTNDVTWESSIPAIAEITTQPEPPPLGLAEGLRQGVTIISAIDAPTGIAGSTTLTVTCPAIEITSPTTLPNGIAGAPYFFKFEQSGGILPIKWELLGDEADIPANLAFSSDGTFGFLSGNLATSTFQEKTFTIRATSDCGSFVEKEFTVTVLIPI